MTHIDHHEMMQKIFEHNNTIEELDIIIKVRQARAAYAHREGEYGSAKEQMLTASLARQLKEYKEEFLTQIEQRWDLVNENNNGNQSR